MEAAEAEAGKDYTHYTPVAPTDQWAPPSRGHTSWAASGVEAGATPTVLYAEAVEASLLHLPVVDGQRRWVEAGPTSSFVGEGRVGRCKRAGGPWG